MSRTSQNATTTPAAGSCRIRGSGTAATRMLWSKTWRHELCPTGGEARGCRWGARGARVVAVVAAVAAVAVVAAQVRRAAGGVPAAGRALIARATVGPHRSATYTGQATPRAARSAASHDAV